MPERELVATNVINWWKGVDQRTQPTLVQDGFFSMTRGTYFGFGDNCIRLPGKKLSTQLPSSILVLFPIQIGTITIIQTLGVLYVVDTASLLAFDPTLIPEAPPAPTFGNVTSTTVIVITPSVLPIFTASFSIQQSPDNSSWTTIATNLATLQNFLVTGLTASTLYYFRFLSVNGGLESQGPSSSVTTGTLSGNIRITEDNNTRITENGNTRITEF